VQHALPCRHLFRLAFAARHSGNFEVLLWLLNLGHQRLLCICADQQMQQVTEVHQHTLTQACTLFDCSQLNKSYAKQAALY